MPEKFFNITGTKFYEYEELMDGVTPKITESGEPDAISLLYSNEN